MLLNAKKLLGEALRVKLLSERCPCKCAFHFEGGIVRVAAAVDYRLARLAGMKDFWQLAPVVRRWEEPPIPSDYEADAGYGEWAFACVRDGDGETCVPGYVEIVGRDDLCVWLTPEQLRHKIRDAQRQACAGDGKRDKIDD